MHQRIPRLVGALGLALALAAGMLSSAMAATPKVTTWGTNLSPAFVSNGGLAAFTVYARDDDTSTLAQFYLTETTSGTRAPSVYAAIASQGTCTQSGQLQCDFGQVKPGVTVTVTVAFTTGAGSSWSPDFEFSTTGFVTGKNRSHGDAFPVTDDLTVQLTNGDRDHAGSYVWDSGQASVADTGITRSNPQSTAVTVSSTGIGAAVSDGSVIGCQGIDVTCPASLFGETSVVSVDNGLPQPAFQIVIDYYKPGVNPNQVNGVYHSWNDASGTGDELITTQCSGSPVPSSVPCFTASKVGPQNLEIIIWTYHNGNYRTF